MSNFVSPPFDWDIEKGGYRFKEGVERNRWPPAPAGALYTPVSLERINCDGQRDGVIFPEDERVPDPLAAKGLTQGEWNEWVLDGFRRITRKRPECCVEFFATVLTCGLYNCCCAVNLVPLLDEWQQDFNQQVLGKKGIYMKIRSHGMRRSPDGNENKGGYLVIYALAFAFDDNRVQELRGLNPNSGYTNKGGCCFPICGNQKDAPIMIQ